MQAQLDFPFIKACGYLTQYGNGTLSASPYLNVGGYNGDMINSMSTAPVTLMYTYANSAALASTDFIRYESISAPYSLDLFSSASSFSVAFYYISTSTSLPQVILAFMTASDSGTCFVGLLVACGSTQCLSFQYYPACNAYNVAATWTVSMTTSVNQWNHVAFVYNSSVQRLYGFLNNNVVATQSVTSSPATAVV